MASHGKRTLEVGRDLIQETGGLGDGAVKIGTAGAVKSGPIHRPFIISGRRFCTSSLRFDILDAGTILTQSD